MKRLLIAFSALLFSVCAFAQIEEPAPPEGYKYVDSVIYTPVPRVNETLSGKSVSDVLPGSVKLHRSFSIKSAAESLIRKNRGEQTDGFRIRIYFDNKQNSREASAESEARFKRLFPGYNTYRTFKNPFFKVTVGDFRTKADAQVALQRISRVFPDAFIVKEKMKFPVISDQVRVTVDTVRMLVPIEPPKPADE
ncbi:MAG: SPOR domain-containing protein [Bacteroidales bacterium]|nr:SPOR domain-containing protein [Bacteroidales bacterium]